MPNAPFSAGRTIRELAPITSLEAWPFALTPFTSMFVEHVTSPASLKSSREFFWTRICPTSPPAAFGVDTSSVVISFVPRKMNHGLPVNVSVALAVPPPVTPRR